MVSNVLLLNVSLKLVDLLQVHCASPPFPHQEHAEVSIAPGTRASCSQSASMGGRFDGGDKRGTRREGGKGASSHKTGTFSCSFIETSAGASVRRWHIRHAAMLCSKQGRYRKPEGHHSIDSPLHSPQHTLSRYSSESKLSAQELAEDMQRCKAEALSEAGHYSLAVDCRRHVSCKRHVR